MPDTYELQSPYGVLEMESDHLPTAAEAQKVIAAYSDHMAAQAQAAAQAKAPGLAAPSLESAGRFLSNAAEVLNPLTAAKGIYQAVTHPIDTASSIIGQQVAQGRQAFDLSRQGRPWEASGHAMAAAIPILGPMAAQAGEQIAAGDVAGGLGKGAGLVAPFAAQKALELRAGAQANRAPLLTREAEQQVASRVLGPANPRYKGRAAAIAPEVLKRKLSGSRLELQQAAEEGMADAGTALDDAITQAGGTQAQIPIRDVTDKLEARIKDLQDSKGQPLSDRAAARIRLLRDKTIQLKATAQGVIRQNQSATFDDLKRIRDEHYDIADKARGYERAGNVAMGDEGWTAREVGSAIRQTFADRSPATAAANADYTFWKTLNDVLDPNIGRPKSTAQPSGVTGGAKTTGAVVGNIVGGKIGAFIMSEVRPWLVNKLNSPEWLLADAQRKIKLANAIKRGDLGTAKSLMVMWGKYAKPTSPSESPSQVPALGTQP